MKQIILSLLSLAVYAEPAMATQEFQWDHTASDALAARVEAGDYGTVTSIVIRQDGNVVFEGYFNDADADTLLDTRSVTKTITSMGVGLAIGQGLLALDQPLAPLFADVVPDDVGTARRASITVEDLLTMSGPLECDDWNSFSRGNEERMYLVEDWAAFYWELPVKGYAGWTTTPQDSRYGRAFSYCTAGVQVLGEAVQRVSGTGFEDFVVTNLFEPMGINDHDWPHTGSGQAHLGGGLRLTARSLSSLAELYRQDGQLDGVQIIPAAWVEASEQPRAVITQGDGQEYGYLWWLIDYHVNGVDYQARAMNGNGGNRVVYMPEFDVSVVITKTDYNTSGMHRLTDEFFATEIFARMN